MKVISIRNQVCEVALGREELRIIHQALNEVCHGVDFSEPEFATRMGTERKTAVDLMNQLREAYETEQEA